MSHTFCKWRVMQEDGVDWWRAQYELDRGTWLDNTWDFLRILPVAPFFIKPFWSFWNMKLLLQGNLCHYHYVEAAPVADQRIWMNCHLHSHVQVQRKSKRQINFYTGTVLDLICSMWGSSLSWSRWFSLCKAWRVQTQFHV